MGAIDILDSCLRLDSYGVAQENGSYHIFFKGLGGNTMFLGDGILTYNFKLAIESSDREFVIEELSKIVTDKNFIEYLEGELLF